MRRLVQIIYYLVFASALFLPTLSNAQSEGLRQLVANRSDDNIVNISADGATGRADIDGTVHLVGDPANGSILVAPNDEAVLAIFAGADLTISDMIFRREGKSRFGIYIDGGNVTLNRCRFEGAFDSSIYLASGSLTLRNCTFEGAVNAVSAQQGASILAEELILLNTTESGIVAQGASLSINGADFRNAGQNAVYVVGPVTLELSDAVFAGSGEIQLALLNGASAKVKNVSFDLDAGIAILTQDANQLTAQEIEILGTGKLGLAVQGLQVLNIEGMAIRLLGSPVQIDEISGAANIQSMYVDVLGSEDYGLNLKNIGSLNISDSIVRGGAVGLLLQGEFGAVQLANNSFFGQTQYGLAIQNTYMEQNPSNANIHDNVVIAANEGVPISLQDTSGFVINDNSLVTAGTIGAIIQNSERIFFEKNTLVTAPDIPESPEMVVETEKGQMYVASGAPNPIQGRLSFEDTENSAANNYLTAASLLKSQNLDQEGHIAVANFWGKGTDPDYSGLLMALSDMNTELADRAVEIASWPLISLAPPPNGYRWSSDAFVVTFRDLQGNEVTAYPSDFPLHLPAGQHAVDVDSRTVAVINVSDDQEIEVPIPDAPYYVWQEEGSLVRGATIRLRKPEVLQTMLEGSRQLAIGEYQGDHELFGARTGISTENAVQARQLALTTLKGMLPLILDAANREAWPERQRLYITQQHLLDFLVEFGKPEDVPFILDELREAGMGSWNAVTTAVRLEQRLGLLDNGLTSQRLAEQLAKDPLEDFTNQLANALSRTGDQRAIAAMVAIHQLKLDDPENDGRVADALRNLSFKNSDVGLEFNRQYLRAMKDAINAELKVSDLSEAWGIISTNSWTTIGRALAYVSSYGDDTDKPLLAFPVPLRADIKPLIEYAESPSSVFSAYLGFEGLVVDGRANGWHRSFGRMVCPALTWRTAGDASFELKSMRYLLRQTVIRDYIKDYYDLSANDKQGYRNWFDLTMDLSVSHCYPTGSAPEIYRSESAQKEEERKFLQVNPSYDPDWWVRPERAAIKMAKLKATDDWPDVSGFSPYSPEYIAQIMGDGGNLDPLFVKVFLMHQRLLTAANQSPQNFYSFGAERRIFKLRSNNGDSVVASYGIVDVRPRWNDGTLQIAIRPNIIAGDYEGGIAGMISAPTYEPFETNNRQAMFESVALEKSGDIFPLTYSYTISGGIHVYEMPWPTSDWANTYLRISMRHVEERWPLDIPLYSSQIAFEQRLNTTEFVLPEVVQ